MSANSKKAPLYHLISKATAYAKKVLSRHFKSTKASHRQHSLRFHTYSAPHMQLRTTHPCGQRMQDNTKERLILTRIIPYTRKCLQLHFFCIAPSTKKTATLSTKAGHDYIIRFSSENKTFSAYPLQRFSLAIIRAFFFAYHKCIT